MFFITRIFCRHLCLALMCVVALMHVATTSGDEPAAEKNATPKITYDEHIAPLLKRRCSSCHSADRTEADLDVTNFVMLMQGGGSGAVIELGSADDSYLFRLVNHDDSPEMPPGGTKIPEKEIQLLKRWIETGALENAGSKFKKRKPKVDLSKVAANPNQRPEVAPMPPRLSKEPVLWTLRKSPTRSVAVNPWSPIAAVTAPKQVVLFNTKTLELIGVVPFTLGQPEVVRFSRNGELLIVGGGIGGDSGKVLMWDVTKGEAIGMIGDELDAVLACDISPDHSLVALGGPKKKVKVYSTSDGELLYEITKHTQWITAIEFSPDGKNIASGDRNGGLIVSDAVTGTENFDLTGHKGHLTSLSFRVDGKILASASMDKSVRTWEMKKGKQIKTWEADGSGATEVCFLPSGKLLTAGRAKEVKLWQQNGKHLRTFQGLDETGMGLAFCDQTQRVIAGSYNGIVKVWDVAETKAVGELNSNPPPIAERIADVQTQLAAAQVVLQTAEDAATTHRQQIEQATAESVDARNQMDDALEQKKKASEAAAVALKEKESADAVLANLSSDDSDAEKRTAVEKNIRRASQQLAVSENQQVAFEGAATALSEHIAKLQEEIGRLNDAAKPIFQQRDVQKAECTRLQNVLDLWVAELEFAAEKK